MKTFQCTSCGHQLQRPTQPFKCPQCGRQAVGLFRVVQGAAPSAPAPGQPQQPAYTPPSPQQPAAPYQPPPSQPPSPGAPAASGHGGISPLAPPPPPPGMQPAQQPPAGYTPQYPAAPQQPAAPYQPPAQQPYPQQPAPRQPAAPQQPPAQPVARQPAPPSTPPAQKSRPAPPPLPPSGAPRPTTKEPPVRKRRPAPAPEPKPEPPKPKPKVRPKPIRPEQFVWAYPPEPPYEDEARAMRNAPAVDSQGRAILFHQGRLVALVEEEGRAKVVWEYVLGSTVPGPVAVAPDGTIRAHCADGYLHCLTPGGRQQWSPAHVGEPLGFAAPVVDGEGYTYISAYNGGLVRVDQDGRPDPKPYFRSRRKLDSAGIIHNGVLYVGSEDGYVFAVQLADRRGRNLWDHSDERGHAGWFVNSSPALTADGTLVVAARDDNLYGFAPDGAQAWRTRMPGQMVGSPVIGPDGQIYVGAFQVQRGQEGRGLLVSVDGNSHKVRWQYEAAGPVESTPVVGDDGLVYFGDNAGTIHAVDAQGKPQWKARVESAVRSAGTILAPHRLAFGLDDDTLVVLNCTAGALAPQGWPKIARDPGQSGLV